MSKYKQETVTGEQKVIQTFIIRNKETKEIWTARSGKSSWKKPNHAACAFANSEYKTRVDPLLSQFTSGLGKYDSLKFKDQDVYEIIELVPESKVVVEDNSKQILAEIRETLYNQGLEVANWHQNGELVSLDDLFEENDWLEE